MEQSEAILIEEFCDNSPDDSVIGCRGGFRMENLNRKPRFVLLSHFSYQGCIHALTDLLKVGHVGLRDAVHNKQIALGLD